jgi:hypothetical protein
MATGFSPVTDLTLTGEGDLLDQQMTEEEKQRRKKLLAAGGNPGGPMGSPVLDLLGKFGG